MSFTEVFYERTNQRAYKASIYIRRHPEQCVRYDSITALTHTHTHTHTHVFSPNYVYVGTYVCVRHVKECQMSHLGMYVTLRNVNLLCLGM